MLDSPLIQVLISLILLLFLGYFAYYVYLIELEEMMKFNESKIRKKVTIMDGIYDFNKPENSYETTDASKKSFRDINPSINQEGGSEYSYNFWLYIDKQKLNEIYRTDSKKDIVLFLKGEKKLYYSNMNKNCSNKSVSDMSYYNVMIKNPLVRLGLNNDKNAIVVEANNIYNPDSYKNRANSSKSCLSIDSSNWMNKNDNLIGVYDLDFDKRWFMVTIIMKEVADSNNILMKNRASCKMYINSMIVLDTKMETYYQDTPYSATFKNNKSPLLVNPSFSSFKQKFQNIYGNHSKINKAEIIKMADLFYFNYALTEPEITQLYSNGFSKSEVDDPSIEDPRYDLVSNDEMEKIQIKEI